jgi:hypothetical protein
MTNLAKPLRAGLKAHFFVIVALDLRMTKAVTPRLEDAGFKSRRISI